MSNHYGNPTAERTANPVQVIRQNLTQMAPELKAALPAHVTPEKFTRVAMTAIQNNPDLQNADRRSLFGAIVRLAQDGLLPDGREAALVLFGNKAQAMPMIAGVLKKVRQSGEVAKGQRPVVYENDLSRCAMALTRMLNTARLLWTNRAAKRSVPMPLPFSTDGSRLLEVTSLEEIREGPQCVALRPERPLGAVVRWPARPLCAACRSACP